jgi:hypothetical protein
MPPPGGEQQMGSEGRWYYDGTLAGEPVRLAAINAISASRR